MAGHRYKERDTLRDPDTGEWDKKELRHRAKSWAAVALAFSVFLVGGIVLATKAIGVWQDFRSKGDYAGSGVADVAVDIPSGASVLKIGSILESADVVKDAKTFQQAASMRPDEAQKLQAGRYKLRTQIPAATALDMLLDPSRSVKIMMQVREGQRMSQELASMAKASGISQDDLASVIDRSSAAELGLPNWAQPPLNATKAEGFLFPDTYQVPNNPTAESVVKVPIAQFNQVASSLDFANKAKATPIKDPWKVLIVASIIEREVYRDEDRPKVARVLYNRLNKGMRLQLDSTVAYAVNKTNTIWTTPEDRQSRSKYNTYRYDGLPPGPISAPAQKALEAALNPAPGDWTYFVPINLDTGETAFTNSKAEHDAAAAKLQAWCKASPANQKKCA